MADVRCFGCHATVEQDDRPQAVLLDGVCDTCAPLGTLQMIARRPRPCMCPHCVHWRRDA